MADLTDCNLGVIPPAVVAKLAGPDRLADLTDCNRLDRVFEELQATERMYRGEPDPRLAAWIACALGLLVRAVDDDERLRRVPARSLGVPAGMALFMVGLRLA